LHWLPVSGGQEPLVPVQLSATSQSPFFARQIVVAGEKPWVQPLPGSQPSVVQTFPSSQLGAGPPTQLPPLQVSPVVQAFPSVQGRVLFVWVQPLAGLQPSVVQTFPSSQFGAGPPTHAPALHVSFVVHALPSVQAVPFGFGGFEHVPVAESQVPVVWHWSEAVQTTGLLPVQTPLWQVSVCVQAFPSLQVLPLAFGGFEHVPVAGSQVPALWHWSEAVQTTALPPVQLPPWQVSVWVHALPSVQVLPFGFGGFEQVPVAGSQVPALWHWSAAVQTTALPPVQLPPWQVSVWVHALPSVQAVPFGFGGFEHVPVAGSQVPAK